MRQRNARFRKADEFDRLLGCDRQWQRFRISQAYIFTGEDYDAPRDETEVFPGMVGYAGGTEPNPTYELVTSERTKYRESLQITYDPSKISFAQLLDIYWKQINPTQSDGQFTDIGPSYRAAIFYGSDEEKKIAEESKERLAKSGRFNKPVVTEILPAMKFWPAEDYHQQYYRKNPEHFEAFEYGSGRVSYGKKTWGEEKKP